MSTSRFIHYNKVHIDYIIGQAHGVLTGMYLLQMVPPVLDQLARGSGMYGQNALLPPRAHAPPPFPF